MKKAWLEFLIEAQKIVPSRDLKLPTVGNLPPAPEDEHGSRVIDVAGVKVEVLRRPKRRGHAG